MCTDASFPCEFFDQHQIKKSLISVWETWQRILAGSGEDWNLPRCQSTTCIVMLWHFKHLECTLCFEASSFPQDEITNQQGGQLWPEGLWGGVATARLPVWLPRPSGNIWWWGEVNELCSLPYSTTTAEVPICKAASFQMIQWQFSGNTGQLPQNETVTVCGNHWGR